MNMYVANLGFHSNEEDLRKLFEPFGLVSSVSVMVDRVTGRNRGIGFVRMDSDADANKAINKLNGKEIEGRFITVSVARDRDGHTDKRDQ